MKAPTVEADCSLWTGGLINLDSDRLPHQLQNVYDRMKDISGKSEKPIPVEPNLTVKQKLAKEIVNEFIEKSIIFLDTYF